jgi:hypothetical protein
MAYADLTTAQTIILLFLVLVLACIVGAGLALGDALMWQFIKHTSLANY